MTALENDDAFLNFDIYYENKFYWLFNQRSRVFDVLLCVIAQM